VDSKVKCEACGGESPGRHDCPYQWEINDDHNEDYCNCCDDCRQRCTDDI
jgi:hypothetical protein